MVSKYSPDLQARFSVHSSVLVVIGHLRPSNSQVCVMQQFLESTQLSPIDLEVPTLSSQQKLHWVVVVVGAWVVGDWVVGDWVV